MHLGPSGVNLIGRSGKIASWGKSARKAEPEAWDGKTTGENRGITHYNEKHFVLVTEKKRKEALPKQENSRCSGYERRV